MTFQTMQTFGYQHPDLIRVSTPAGRTCAACERVIVVGDHGFMIPTLDADGESLRPWHRLCFIRTVDPNYREKCPDCDGTGRVRIPDGIAPCTCRAESAR